MYSDHR
jgi:hypothetical protein